MSDPVSNVEIEDVLSSIRRLVSEDTRTKPASRPAHAERLVLTPSLRVTEDTAPATVADEDIPEPFVLDETLAAPAEAETLEEDIEATDTAEALDLGSVALTPVDFDDETEAEDDALDIEVAHEAQYFARPVWLRQPVEEADDLEGDAEAFATVGTEVEEILDGSEIDLESKVEGWEEAKSESFLTDQESVEEVHEPAPVLDGTEADHGVSDHDQDVLSSLDALLAEAANAPGAPPEPTDEELDDSLAMVLKGADEDVTPDSLDVDEEGDYGSDGITTQSILSKLVEQEVSRALGQDLVFEEEGEPVSAEDAELFAEAFEADEDLFADDEDETAETPSVEDAKPLRPTVRLSVVRPQPPEPDDGIEDAEILDDAFETATMESNVASEEIAASLPGTDGDDITEEPDFSGATLEAKIAELETLVGAQPHEWDPEPTAGAAAFFHRSSTRTNRPDVFSHTVDTTKDKTEAPVERAAEPLQPAEMPAFDEDALREIVSDIIRQELKGVLGERITRNVRKLVRREIHRVLVSQDLE